MTERLSDRICLVTGAGSGIGAAVARRFTQEGGHVYLLDRNADAAAQVAAEIAAAGGDTSVRTLDVSNADDVRAAIAGIHTEAGRIDVLVNVAGISLI